MEILTVISLLTHKNRICVIHFTCSVQKVSLCKSSPPELTTQCCAQFFSHVRLFVTPWTLARQAPLSLGFSRQEYQSGMPCPPPGDLPNPEMERRSLASPPLAGRFFTAVPSGKPQSLSILHKSFCLRSILDGISRYFLPRLGMLLCPWGLHGAFETPDHLHKTDKQTPNCSPRCSRKPQEIIGLWPHFRLISEMHVE